MKKIITLTMVLVMMTISIGGCYSWRGEEIDRWNRRGGYDSKIFDSQGYDRGEGHDHDWGGGHVDDERK
jgi:hypothetical protein